MTLSSVYCLLEHEDIEVVACELEAASRLGLSLLLSSAERDRAARFAFAPHRRRYIAARGTLRLLLAQRLEVAPESIEIATLPRGKPVLGGRFADCGLRFNLSHSENIAVYAFATGRDIGVDVEAVRVLDDADDIATRVFSAREKAIFANLTASERVLGFFNCWTRKEAFIKAVGDGLHYPLDSFDVSLSPADTPELLRVGDTPGAVSDWTLEGFSFGDFVGAVVTQKRPAARPRVHLIQQAAVASVPLIESHGITTQRVAPTVP